MAVIVLTGCTATGPAQPPVTEKEAVRHEPAPAKTPPKTKIPLPRSNVRWVQPANKHEACRLYVSIDPDNDKTQKKGYTLYWDGDCQDGYAFGLGREFENSAFSHTEQIGIYKEGMAQVYCVQTDSLTGVTIEGECFYSSDKVSHFVQTTLDDHAEELVIKFQYGAGGTKNAPALLTFSSPFRDNTVHLKAYPDSAYQIWDFTHNPLDRRDYEFNLLKGGKPNGLGFTSFKDGTVHGGEMVNGILRRSVELPWGYRDKADSILHEIETAGLKAITAQRQARAIKRKYKQKICRDDVNVDFMSKEHYKAICHEAEKFEKLKAKMEKQLKRIKKRSAKKRQEMRDSGQSLQTAAPDLQTQQLTDILFTLD